MGFRENLKSQLQYSGMMIKELAALSGMKQKTLDSYLGSRGYTPSVYAAIDIANALGVSVEYLATGDERKKERALSSLPKDVQEIALAAERLAPKEREILRTLTRMLRNK